jgi:hypothetical protein
LVEQCIPLFSFRSVINVLPEDQGSVFVVSPGVGMSLPSRRQQCTAVSRLISQTIAQYRRAALPGLVPRPSTYALEAVLDKINADSIAWACSKALNAPHMPGFLHRDGMTDWNMASNNAVGNTSSS